MKIFILAFMAPFFASAAMAQSASQLCIDEFWITASSAEITAAIATQDVSAICEFGLFPLHKAAKFGTAADIAAVVARGAYVNQTSIHFGSPLHVAAFGKNVETIAALVEAGGDVNNQLAPNQSSPLHLAVEFGGTVAHIEALLKVGANLNLADQSGLTPLDEAIDIYRPEMAAALRAAGAIESKN